MKSFQSAIALLKQSISNTRNFDRRLDEIKIHQGIVFSELNKNKHSLNLQDYEFQIFSQWGEDGILQHLTNVVDIPNKAFVEFGVQDFSESNCRFLLMKDNWDGFIIDGSSANVQAIKNSYYYYKHNLVAVDAFITADNINDLLAQSHFSEDLGILSIDLDGNDYFILDAIRFFRPRILVCEYNAVFGATRSISVPYDAAFVRSKKHYSYLYYGASLGALAHLAKGKGYSLVGTNSAGNNAFFVRNDLLNSRVQSLDVQSAFTQAKFRESRNEEGLLTYLSGNVRLDLLRGLPVLNVETGAAEEL